MRKTRFIPSYSSYACQNERIDIMDRPFFRGDNYGLVMISPEYDEKKKECALIGKAYGSEPGEKVVFRKIIELRKGEHHNFYGMLNTAMADIKNEINRGKPENQAVSRNYNPLRQRLSFWLFPKLETESHATLISNGKLPPV